MVDGFPERREIRKNKRSYMRKGNIWRLAITVIMVLVTVLTFAAPVAAAKPGGQPDALNDTVVSAADYHLAKQGTYSGIPYTWPWVIGTTNGYWNVVGISATGLLSAYEKTNNEAYLTGAVGTGNALKDRYASVPATQRPYSQDIEFLVRLSQDSGDNSYADVARQWYARTTSQYTGAAYADYYISVRKSLAGWDLASQIRAAVAVGEIDFASDMVARIIERRPDWEGVLYGGWDYTMSSYTSLLWALAELDNSDFNCFKAEIRDIVINAQNADGSWNGDYQDTAYAILGLTADGGASGPQAKAWAFLRDTRTAGAGWSYPPEYGEINSEVIMALAGLDLKGLKAGYTDPNPNRGKDFGKHKLEPAL